MCGILALFGSTVPSLDTLRRRGPDETGTWTGDNVFMGHTRLSIVQPEAGPQPILWKDWVLVINGEIYNAGVCENTTDCYIVPPLLEKHGPLAPCHMDGIFSFVAYHKVRKTFIVARDAIGVTPLYMGVGEDGMCFSSLLAAIPANMATKVVPPGYSTECAVGSAPTFTAWTPPFNPWADLSLVLPDADRLVQNMTAAVQKRITLGDVPWGVLLSGGLDSTIVAALACRLATQRPDYPRVHTFCTGLRDSPDVHWAEQVAHELGTHHTSVIYTVEEAVAAVPEVIRAVETYDVTTIRASTPMWLLARAIRRRGIKMVLSGEGSDELFAGYLYNLYCPSERHMVDECVRKIEQLHSYDCARANKSMGDWGVETRVPFLDRAVVDFAMNQLHPRYKLSGTHPEGKRPEKWWLRDVFRRRIPACVVDRTKAQFSDAVGAGHIMALKAHAEQFVSDDMMTRAKRRFPHNTPTTKEAYWYRHLFAAQFPQRDSEKTVLFSADSIACSTGNASTWHEKFQKCLDPSGEAIHTAFA